ncbi:MAG: nucleotidyltransferase domain-containing protein [Phycisphaerae bacterium]|nr:nucleotidyltransferase domain-containing protein [Phycisphaerae bacterium]
MQSRCDVSRVIEAILDRLIAEYQPEKVILFGSCAREGSGSHSDVDLLIIKETDESFIDRWSKVRGIVSDPNRMVGLDTFVLTPDEVARGVARGDQFLADVLANGEVLYAT